MQLRTAESVVCRNEERDEKKSDPEGAQTRIERKSRSVIRNWFIACGQPFAWDDLHRQVQCIGEGYLPPSRPITHGFFCRGHRLLAHPSAFFHDMGSMSLAVMERTYFRLCRRLQTREKRRTEDPDGLTKNDGHYDHYRESLNTSSHHGLLLSLDGAFVIRREAGGTDTVDNNHSAGVLFLRHYHQ